MNGWLFSVLRVGLDCCLVAKFGGDFHVGVDYEEVGGVVMRLGLGGVVEDMGLCGKLVGFYCLVEVQDCMRFLFDVALI